jgi:hypothetical protein
MENATSNCEIAFKAMASAVRGMRHDEIIDGALNLVAACICQRHSNVTLAEADDIFRATCSDLRLMLVNNGYLRPESAAAN